MNSKIVAALFALVALPAAAQTGAPRGDAGQAPVQARQGKSKADGVVTPKECATLAKAQNKRSKKVDGRKLEPQKKAPAAG